jgi:hypothetical protein
VLLRVGHQPTPDFAGLWRGNDQAIVIHGPLPSHGPAGLMRGPAGMRLSDVGAVRAARGSLGVLPVARRVHGRRPLAGEVGAPDPRPLPDRSSAGPLNDPSEPSTRSGSASTEHRW